MKKRTAYIEHLDAKTAVVFAAVLLCLLSLLLLKGRGSADTVAAAETPAPLSSPAGLRIAVASDLHLDPDNTDKSGTLSAVLYSPELVDALLWDAQQQGAKLILLTGDLVNGGKLHRHEALTEKLRHAEAECIDIYVLPGNHDLAPISQEGFATLYSDFGYSEAFSRDASSLSYCILREDLMLLMMDTAGYSPSAINLPGAPQRSSMDGFFTENTLHWAESMLQEARERNLPVLCAGHYNLLTEISRQPGSGYCVENADRFVALLQKYQVPLYLSGHMHTRAVYQEDGLTELLTEYLLGYPTGYSLLDLTDRALSYTPRQVDVDAWAAATGQEDPVLRSFAEWQQDGLRAYSRSNVSYMSQRNPLTKQEAEQAADFFYAVMDAFWDGSLSQKRASLELMPGYAPFFRCAEGYSYGWWLKDLIQNASPMLAGFQLELP